MKLPVVQTLILLAIAPSNAESFTVQPLGKVIGWGDINNPSVGLRSGYSPDGTVSISGKILENAVAIAAGDGHCLAIRSDGTVVGWGWNKYGQVNNSPSDEIAGTNGVVMHDGQPLTGVEAVAAGRDHSLALRRDGTVVAWGKNGSEHTTEVPSRLSNVIAIAAGDRHSLALKSDGTIVSWGDANPPPSGLSNVIAVAATRSWFYYDLALRSDGTVAQWPIRGKPENEIPLPVGLSNVVAISAGVNHCLALRKDGIVFGWGNNTYGEATGSPATTGSEQSGGIVKLEGSVLSNVIAVAAGPQCSVALRRDGTVVSWGSTLRRQSSVPPGISNVIAIAVGNEYCLAIAANFPVGDGP